MCVLVSTMYSVSLVDSPSISLGDQARVAEGVLNEREVKLDYYNFYPKFSIQLLL